MSLKTGTYLGGIKNLRTLRDRCHVDHGTRCWHWRLSTQKETGTPVVWIRGRGRSCKGRHAALILKLHRELLPGHCAVPRCESRDCVNPAHAFEGTRDDLGAYLRAVQRLKGVPKRLLANSRTGRSKGRLDEAKAAEIRASNESTYALAKKYGVAQSTTWAIKRGLIWRELAPNASVFNMRA